MNQNRAQQTLQQALTHHQAGRLKQAEALYRQARAAAPRSFDVLNLSGLLAYQQGRFPEAVELLRKACEVNPGSAISHARHGMALASSGLHTDAVIKLRASAQIDPKNHETWNSLAFSLRVIGQIPESIAAYEKAIEQKPDYFEAIDRLGAIIADTRGLPAGIPYFRRVLELQPSYSPALGNLGLALSADAKYGDAIEAFDKALKLDPKLAQARVGRALAFQKTYRIKEAAEEFAAVLINHPTNHESRSGLLLTLNYISGIPRQRLFDEHIAFNEAAHSALRDRKPVVFAPRSTSSTRPLKLAFLSPDLRKHSVAYFIEPLLRHLDPAQFEIILYHDHFQVDTMSERLRAHAKLWRNFVGQLHDTVEKTIRADAPDILIDLAGHTGLSRLPVFARRVAPVQISYLGYPNTTGLHEMDYRFVDPVTDPEPEADAFHTEKLIRFAPCAWAYEPPETAPLPQRTVDNAQPIVFGSFNNFAKVSDATLELWRRVLTAVPGSLLVLKGYGLENPAIAKSIQEKFRGLVDDPARIKLHGRTADLAEHLRLYSGMDIALDTFPYHGTTTTCEAVWMGVPVVTLLGDRHAARVSASLLTAINHPEWIAQTDDDYVRIAIELANDPTRLAALRTTLREDVRRSPLLDHAGQAARFAAALKASWQKT